MHMTVQMQTGARVSSSAGSFSGSSSSFRSLSGSVDGVSCSDSGGGDGDGSGSDMGSSSSGGSSTISSLLVYISIQSIIIHYIKAKGLTSSVHLPTISTQNQVFPVKPMIMY